MQKQILLIATVSFLIAATVNGQTKNRDSTYRKCFIGSTFFMLGNLNSKNRPDFVQLNFGYRVTPRDAVSIELKTWKYAWPLGIPYGKSFEASNEKYPGHVRELGIALAYQRFLWKGVYAAAHAFNAKQTYVDDNNKKIQNGYQLFMTYRLGYHVPLFKKRFFIEPSVGITHWPINTNVPEQFAVLEKKWKNYFLFEPGLHFGLNF